MKLWFYDPSVLVREPPCIGSDDAVARQNAIAQLVLGRH